MISRTDLLTTIQNIEDNSDNLRLLIEQLRTSIGIIPFIGAGLAIPFGFPGWGSFLIAQAKKAGVGEKILQRLDEGEYEEAAEDLLAARGYRAFHDSITSTFGIHKLADKELKGAVSFLPQLAAGPIITTNFDHVLEEVFKQSSSPFEREVWGTNAELATRALYQNRRFLLKIHGDAEDSTNRILTKSDYLSHYGSVDGSSIDLSLPLPRLLQQMLVGRPLLFLGCSLNQDRTIAVLEQVSQSFRFIAHYAVVEQPVSTEQFHERSRFLSNHSIRPIWYPNGRHDLIEPLLGLLSEEVSTKSLPNPPERPWLNNEEIREFIDTMTNKVVLILGRFTPERKFILDSLREELRKRDYTAILFDFEKPANRNITETLSILAHLSYFIIADITEARSVPQQLMSIVPALPSVPVLPLLQSDYYEFGAFQDFRFYPWVLETVRYDGIKDIIDNLPDRIIAPAEAKAKEIRQNQLLLDGS